MHSADLLKDIEDFININNQPTPGE